MVQPRQLPVLPAAHARALSLLRDPDVAIAAIAAVVESDPALTAALLRIANSAASAPVNRVTTAQRAVMRVGLGGTRNAVTAAVMRHSFGDLRDSGLDLNELWRHVVSCAVIADRAASGPLRSAAFTAGLLHDVGRLAMAYAEPRRYAQVVTAVHGGADPREAERHIFGEDHEAVGMVVALEWGLPEEVAAAVGGHHVVGPNSVTRAVHAARLLAGELGIGDGVVAAGEATSPDTLADEPRTLLSLLGGAESLATHVAWFSGMAA